MFKTVSEKVKLERLSICKGCEHFVASYKTCKKCGCYMPAKTMFAATSCPIDKWQKNQPGQSLINTIEEEILKSWNNQ
jgi:hypothetical protein